MLDMTSSLALLAVLAAVAYWIKDKLMGNAGSLDHLPGPPGIPFLGNSLQVKMSHARLKFTEWSKMYGQIYRVKLLTGDTVVVSEFDAQTEMLLGPNNNSAGGRQQFFRQDLYTEKTGVVFNPEPDLKWQTMRKISQRHIKQFGDGINRIEQVVFDVTEDMHEVFSKAAETGEELNPLREIRATALKIIVFLIIGRRVTDDDRIFQMLLKLEPLVWKTITMGAPRYLFMDALPVLFHLPTLGKRHLQQMMNLKEECVKELQQFAYDDDNLLRSLLEQASDDPKDGAVMKTREAALACINMVVAGQSTTSFTFHVLLNIIAQRPEVQEKCYQEIKRCVAAEDENVTLSYRSKLHYTRAVIFEVLRYYPVAPLIPRRAVGEMTVAGHRIPKGAHITVNTWGLHRSKDFWGDPEVFRPERFLNADGTLVNADHPSRAHVRPFCVGVRTCVGKQLANARVFIWTTNVIKRFTISPGEGCDEESADPRKFTDAFLLLPTEYKIKLKKRV